MYTLSCLAELIGYSSCFLNDKFSRKKCLIFFISSAGIVCFLCTLIPKELAGETTWRSGLGILAASVGKVFVSACFSSIYVYTIRMFPTNVRSTMFAICNSTGRIGSIIAPQINLLRLLVWDPLPYLIFSVNAGAAALAVKFLPNPSKIVF